MKKNNFLYNNWLVILIAMQPVLDVLAYWMQNSVATVAGYLRLAIMFAVPIAVFIKCRDKKKLVIPCSVIALFCALHVLNAFRVGYHSIFSDIQYILRVIQMPVFAVSFMCCADDEGFINQAVRGIKLAAIIFVSIFAIAVITGTYTPTYSDNVGYSGWVIDGNRCANSIILVTLCTFIMYFAYGSDKSFVRLLLPVAVSLMLIMNGTRSCYISAVGLMAAYAVFALMEKLFKGKNIRWDIFAVTVILCISSVIIYPYTPNAIEESKERNGKAELEIQFRKELSDAGYDIDLMSIEEKLAVPFVADKFTTYYHRIIDGGVPVLLEDYDIERVFRAYDMTADIARIMDVRVMKRMYSRFVFEDSDMLTKLVGFDFSRLSTRAINLDLENDYPAILYYYGYAGFALLIGFILYFIYLILRALVTDFKGSLTALNYTLAVSLALQLALAQLSGALLRRPNVSVYLSVILALIYFRTNGKSLKGASAHE